MHTANGDYMNFQWAVGLPFLCIPLCYRLAKKMGLVFGIFASVVSMNSCITALYMYGKYRAHPVDMQNALSIDSCFGFLALLIVVLGMSEMPGRWLLAIRRIIPIYAVIGALIMVYHRQIGFKLNGGYGYQGYQDYCGMAGTLLAVCAGFFIPKSSDVFFVRLFKLSGLLIVLAGVWLAKTAIPFIVFGIVLSVSLCRARPSFSSLFSVWPLLIALGFGWRNVGTKMINSSHRFEAYRVFMGDFFKSSVWIMGTGISTFRAWAPHIQMSHKFMLTENGGWFWPFMHSDLLQAHFELGCVGGMLLILTYFTALARCILEDDREWLAFGMGLLVAGLVNYPVHYFEGAFLVALFLVQALSHPEQTLGQTPDPKGQLPAYALKSSLVEEESEYQAHNTD